LCDTNQPPNCATENARFGFVLDEVTGFFRARFTMPGLDMSANSFSSSGTNASRQLVVSGPCAINGIRVLNVVLTNTYQNVTTSYITNSSGILTNFVTNIVTRIETNTATFTFLLRAAQAPTNTFQIRLAAQVGTNVIAQSLETASGQPVRTGAIIVNSSRALQATSIQSAQAVANRIQSVAQSASPTAKPPAKPTKKSKPPPPKTKNALKGAPLGRH